MSLSRLANEEGVYASSRFHYTSYMPIGDELYEFDGLKSQPLCHGPIPGGREAWLDAARDVIETHMRTYAEGEVRQFGAKHL